MRMRWLSLVGMVVGCSTSATHPATTGTAGADASATAGATGSAGASGGAAGGNGTAGASGGSSSGSSGATGAAGGGQDAGGVAGDAAADQGGGPRDGASAESFTEIDPDSVGNGDITIGPTYANAPELTANPAVPKGVVSMFNMKSSDSAIYPGLTGPYTRPVWLYVPAQYVPGTAAPFIIAQDGDNYLTRLPVILDNMIAAHRLPVMLAVMADSGGGNSKGSERGLEY